MIMYKDLNTEKKHNQKPYRYRPAIIEQFN